MGFFEGLKNIGSATLEGSKDVGSSILQGGKNLLGGLKDSAGDLSDFVYQAKDVGEALGLIDKETTQPDIVYLQDPANSKNMSNPVIAKSGFNIHNPIHIGLLAAIGLGSIFILKKVLK